MRYIDADGFKERTMQIGIQQGKEEFAVFLCKYIDTVPTADVVPKSEVEELEAECERQYEQAKADILANMADGGTSCHWCIDEHKAQAKAEVAREIFEEIETCMKNFEDDDDSYLLKKCEFEFFMRELKKIYAEEKE